MYSNSNKLHFREPLAFWTAFSVCLNSLILPIPSLASMLTHSTTSSSNAAMDTSDYTCVLAVMSSSAFKFFVSLRHWLHSNYSNLNVLYFRERFSCVLLCTLIFSYS
ncbi:hypothetical protein BDN72DRAFT_625796 [Pluteus cervinus]|uniref:Uncharacterized protein n=1 Tax=Pluteus cervinus TaxID=181527 RepID=A0ACD3A0S8_9AGAR|nr:hypothetical protein BDN72DRAFT_625796 [Pluteus cervinus]